MVKIFNCKPSLLLVAVASIIVNACSEPDIEAVPEEESEDYFVSIEEATSFATILEYQTADGESGRTTSEFKDIDKVYEIPDENGTPLYYIINYKDNGFISISADTRTFPIRAFSPNGRFPEPGEDTSVGIIDWLQNTAETIGDIRELDQLEYSAVPEWNTCDMQQIITTIDDGGGCSGGTGGGSGGGDCQHEYTSYGPLITS
ncbi:MAG: Spi family protease inhibitor, partial [Ekhidna sp.]|nr:Spi family protease inhibitor [Ekhidna sp.]